MAFGIKRLLCSFSLWLSATGAGPLTIKRNQCEHAEANGTDTVIIVNNKFGDRVRDGKVEPTAGEKEPSEHGQT